MARVLVIEDNPASLQLMLYLLKAFGHETLDARDGLRGIEVARKERPDLILCDIQLPGATGIQVCEELKRDPAFRHIPLIAVTAYAMVGDREKLLSHGFDGYLSKPIQAETFVDQIKRYLTGSRVSTAPRAGSISKTIKTAHGTVLVVDNSEVNLSLSRSMLEPFGYEVIVAKSVDQALSLLQENSPDLILSDLHMPVKDGFDFIEAVKADAALGQIPFVFISSTLWGEREREKAFSLGALQFIVRPIEPKALIDEIELCRRKANENGN